MQAQETGKRGEARAQQWIRTKGLNSERAGYYAPFDLVANGWRIEVKTAKMQPNGHWRFNVHRRGKINELDVDFYLLVLEGVPFCKANVYLLRRAPMETPTIDLSVRGLILDRKYVLNDISELMHNSGPLQADRSKA